MAQISIRIDDNLKIEAEQLFNELGLTLSGAFTIFIRQSLRQGRYPICCNDPSRPVL
ncbi:MAG: type II toxin-antitoxin system RelB/DinJ family antitoxin [Treponema sp.]|nr:type II toxin-antitoxin system RelB/DinJ family antitoxin [Treponema sp.]